MNKISVIISVYNEVASVRDCLYSLEKQSYRDFEIIIVDDGSTDETFKTVSEIQNLETKQNNLKIQILKQNHKGTGAARNLGAKHAKGDILVIVDADMTFDKDYLKILTKPLIDSKTKGTFNKEEYVSNWDKVWARCWSINEGWDGKSRHPKGYSDRQKVFRAILKSEFDKVGGFTPGGYNDDWSLSEKLGYKAINTPGAIFYHKNPASLKEIYYHAKWVGKRKYKLGFIGVMVALVRASLPISLVTGLFKSIVNLQPAFIIFKIVNDTGIFVGVLEKTLYGNSAK